MSTCAYCTSDAHYIYAINRDVQKTYCSSHVPRFLHKQRDAGLLPTTPEFETAKAAALGILASVVEEPVVEEAPKPKVRKKNAPSAEELVEAQADATVEEVVEEEPVVEEAEVVEEAPAEDTE